MQYLDIYLQKDLLFTPILAYNFMHVSCFNLCNQILFPVIINSPYCFAILLR